MVLASSTSEAYAWLFKLLCDPGDEVLVPVPSYPLFELLTGLESVRTRSYRLDPHTGWAIDRASVDAALTTRTRAVLLVSPNNPTGSFVHDDDRQWLVQPGRRAAQSRSSQTKCSATTASGRRLVRASFAGENRALTFTLGRAVEVGRAAAAEAGLDRRQRAGRLGCAEALAAPGDHRGHLPLGVDAGAGGGVANC